MLKRVIVAVAVLTSVLVAVPARAAPSVRFLNPSGYTTARVLSNDVDTDSNYHVVVWVREVPATPIVEIELQHAITGTSTFTAERVGISDTWEAYLPLNVDDGTYTLRAILYSDDTEVAVANQTVTVNRNDVPPPPPAETVEITSPDNGGAAGFFTPKGKATNTVVRITGSQGADRARVLYTLSDPGDDPVWTQCGAGTFQNQRVIVRCTLEENASPLDVSAIAAVANNTPPPSPPDPIADDTGDAHRVFPYLQVPTSVDITPESRRAQALDACELFTATVLDQQNSAIAAANVDIHAVGPNDQLRFGTLPIDPLTNATSPFQPPDKNHLNTEAAIRCTDDQPLGQQGDHNVPGSSDPKHIESVAGTGNDGSFAFALHAENVGGTTITAYADVDDDDVQQLSEASGGALLGWGQEPPPPTRQLFIDPASSSSRIGNCQRVVLIARESGAPLAGANVDVHASGPDDSLSFCTPSDGSLTRAPDTPHTDDPSVRHVEGETNASGQFIFGLLSSTPGQTSIVGWLDGVDDDVLSTGEINVNGTITWEMAGERSISLERERGSVPAGTRVRLFGQITGDPDCVSAQVVKLKRRRTGVGRFRTIAQKTTDAEGNYSFRPVVERDSEFKTVAPPGGICQKAVSPIVRVKAR